MLKILQKSYKSKKKGGKNVQISYFLFYPDLVISAESA